MCECAHAHTRGLSHIQLFATQWTVASQAPLFMEIPRQEYWSGLSSPTPDPFDDQLNLMVSCSNLFPLPDHEEL